MCVGVRAWVGGWVGDDGEEGGGDRGELTHVSCTTYNVMFNVGETLRPFAAVAECERPRKDVNG